MEKEREERRKNMEDKRNERAAEERRNRENGNPGDVDFQRMIREYREEVAHLSQPHAPPGEMKVSLPFPFAPQILITVKIRYAFAYASALLMPKRF